MATIDPRTWLEILPPTSCWDLLRTVPVGRVGVLVDSAPEIYPVNFAVNGGSVVFRTDPGSKLRGLDRSPSVAFEADSIDVVRHRGWSVLVKGRASEITDPAEIRQAMGLRLPLWSVGEKAHWVRITPTEITGRRLHPPVPNPG